jgi:hypothetical protein
MVILIGVQLSVSILNNNPKPSPKIAQPWKYIYKPIRLAIHYTHHHHHHFATSVCNNNMVAKTIGMYQQHGCKNHWNVPTTWLQKLLAKTIGMYQLSTTHNWVHHRMWLVFVTGSRIIGDRQRGSGGDEGDR